MSCIVKMRHYLNEHNIPDAREKAERFSLYIEKLLEWGTHTNLTSITDEDEIVEKHFIDSIAPLFLFPISDGASLIDVGTGAGFPAIPMKIVRPDLELTLLDSLNKRLIFLDELCGELGIDAEIVHSRAEDAGRLAEYRERYDIATSRAVAALRTLCEYCIPFVKPGGHFISLKGDAEDELKEAETAIHLLGGDVSDVVKYNIGENRRSIVVIKKISQTPTIYPRNPKQISKKPLD